MFLDACRRRAILTGIFEKYYGNITDTVVFDTNRAWCARMDLIADLFPDAKVIACVRQLGHVIDSTERQYRAQALAPPTIFQGATVYSRVEAAVRGDGFAGGAWNSLKEAYYGQHSNRLMLLRYETLVSCPTLAMGELYAFIGEDHYAHDFDNVVFDDAGAREYDLKVGIPGLHGVAPKIRESAPRVPVIPPDLFIKCQIDNFWENPKLNSRNVKVI